MKRWIWDRLLDPLVRRIESRIEHHRSLRPITHDGSRWAGSARLGRGVLFYPEATLANGTGPDSLEIGDYTHIRGEICVNPGGRVRIGSHCFLGPGSRIWSSAGITIGRHVLISHLVDIHDSDSHSLDWRARREEGQRLFEAREPHGSPAAEAAPVTIGDDAWIGLKATILKGVTIGRGAVVAAGSVVTQDVEPFTMVAGNPARVVKRLAE